MRTLSFTIFLTLILTIGYSFSSGQGKEQNFQQIVLQKAIIDSTFILGQCTEDGGTETHLKYLGKLTTVHGRTFKILNSTNFWGLSHRATSRILVFDAKNNYVGNYYVALITDLPTNLENGKFIFKNETEDCDKNLRTVIDLKEGLPKQFFKKCKGQYGDIYSFEK
jgi:hypothetical protein